MQKCMVCGSNKILLWLGGSIGTLYHCTGCYYVGPVILEPVEAASEGLIDVSPNLFKDGTFWSETGIGNRSLFET